MKNLSRIIPAMCLVCLLSLQASTESYAVVQLKKHPVYAQPSQTQVQAVQQWAASSSRHVQTPQISQNIQQSGDDATQQLQQFSQQTKEELANFGKL